MTQKWYAVRGVDALVPDAIYTEYEGEPVEAARYDALVTELTTVRENQLTQSAKNCARLANVTLDAERMKQRAEMAETAITAFVVAVDKYGEACRELGAQGLPAPVFAVWYQRFVEAHKQVHP